jgi:hypothetical protein
VPAHQHFSWPIRALLTSGACVRGGQGVAAVGRQNPQRIDSSLQLNDQSQPDCHRLDQARPSLIASLIQPRPEPFGARHSAWAAEVVLHMPQIMKPGRRQHLGRIRPGDPSPGIGLYRGKGQDWRAKSSASRADPRTAPPRPRLSCTGRLRTELILAVGVVLEIVLVFGPGRPEGAGLAHLGHDLAGPEA